jgi:hypothetical protein
MDSGTSLDNPNFSTRPFRVLTLASVPFLRAKLNKNLGHYNQRFTYFFTVSVVPLPKAVKLRRLLA